MGVSCSRMKDVWRTMGVEQGRNASYVHATQGFEGVDGGYLAAGRATEGWQCEGVGGIVRVRSRMQDVRLEKGEDAGKEYRHDGERGGAGSPGRARRWRIV